jgi:hypothetical protein
LSRGFGQIERDKGCFGPKQTGTETQAPTSFLSYYSSTLLIAMTLRPVPAPPHDDRRP